MTVNCFQINKELKLIPCDRELAIKWTRDPDSKIWIDFQGAETSQLESLLDQLEIRGLTRRLCIDGRGRPGFYPLNSSIFMVIPVQAAEEDLNEVEYVAALCRQNLLLTLRNERNSPIQQITNLQESVDWLSNGSIPGLISSMLMVLSLDSIQKLSDLRENITAIEKQMDRNPDLIDMKEISDRRSKLLTLEAIVSGQLPSFQALTATDKPFFKLDIAREHLVSAMANLQAADRTLHWLEGRMEVIRTNYEMRAQDKTNRRLSRLTILSTIFMPITFLAGIWGMNFDHMPLLTTSYGYIIAVGFMFLIGGGMFFYFRSKGWFE